MAALRDNEVIALISITLNRNGFYVSEYISKLHFTPCNIYFDTPIWFLSRNTVSVFFLIFAVSNDLIIKYTKIKHLGMNPMAIIHAASEFTLLEISLTELSVIPLSQ